MRVISPVSGTAPAHAEHEGRAHGGMAGKRDLCTRCEDAHPAGMFRLFRREDEDCLRVIELPGDLLHLLPGQPLGFRQHRQLVAAKALGGEDVKS